MYLVIWRLVETILVPLDVFVYRQKENDINYPYIFQGYYLWGWGAYSYVYVACEVWPWSIVFRLCLCFT